MVQCTALVPLLLLPTVFSSSDWNYQQNSLHGPQHWKGCGGTRQSPIDIAREEVEGRSSRSSPLTLANYDQLPVKSQLVNNGHSVKLTNHYQPGLTPRMSGADLDNNYKFGQVHFHWGNVSSTGSEHTIDGQQFPMEMHLVHFKEKFNDIGSAAGENQSDSLAVLGIFFQVSSNSTSHPGVAKLLPALRQVRAANTEVEITETFPLSDLVTGDLTKLIRYSGGLTTPGCNEIVKWTVVETPVEITESQLEEFRQLLTKDGKPLVNNFRPTQKLNSRAVQRLETGSPVWCSVHHPALRASSSRIQVNLLLILLLAPLAHH